MAVLFGNTVIGQYMTTLVDNILPAIGHSLPCI